ncbi:hypothetical protein KIPB_013036, partial [Kipferlia bialata]|eukprot:g13036.t1
MDGRGLEGGAAESSGTAPAPIVSASGDTGTASQGAVLPTVDTASAPVLAVDTGTIGDPAPVASQGQS